jgi:SAM-dependent methyltransferase
MGNTDWFESWFDTSYYHTLYKNRDNKEAETFIGNLVELIQLPLHSQLLDLACGKGRHSITLYTHGYNVLGVDLSPHSIDAAEYFSNENLQFQVHDMREVIPGKKFDGVFNLFTSFGYFDSSEDNIRVLQSVHEMLNPDGVLVIDFMNASKVIANLVTEETKEIDGITFHINRKYDGSHIFKYIQFEADGENHNYMERVQALKLIDFEFLLQHCGFNLIRTFGNFELKAFDETTSDRLILIARKR